MRERPSVLRWKRDDDEASRKELLFRLVPNPIRGRLSGPLRFGGLGEVMHGDMAIDEENRRNNFCGYFVSRVNTARPAPEMPNGPDGGRSAIPRERWWFVEQNKPRRVGHPGGGLFAQSFETVC
jgi:hypothetical protein